MKNDLSIIYTTINSDVEAKQISTILLKCKLIACANIIPNIKSLYMWNDKLEESHEFIIFMKTLSSVVEKTVDKLKEIHPYDCPAIIILPTNEVNDNYLEFVKNSLK